jgi:hypothetical protein
MAKKVRFWWTLLVAWLVNMLPVPHVEVPRPSIVRITQDHDTDAGSEQPSASQAKKQRTEIAPPRAEIPRFVSVMQNDAAYRRNHSAVWSSLPQFRNTPASR